MLELSALAYDLPRLLLQGLYLRWHSELILLHEISNGIMALTYFSPSLFSVNGGLSAQRPALLSGHSASIARKPTRDRGKRIFSPREIFAYDFSQNIYKHLDKIKDLYFRMTAKKSSSILSDKKMRLS